jgi:acyl-homoserine lactone acylase PvdQ
VDSRYLELLESERFGVTRSHAQHMAALDKERTYTYKPKITSSQPSSEHIDLLRLEWQSLRYKQARKLAKWRLLRGKQDG